MAEFPYLPIDVRAFMADTQHLDARETGAYAALLFHAWLAADNGLPNDDKRLAMLARCTPSEWRKIRSTVLSFWFLGQNGKWHQKRLDATRKDVGIRSSKASSAAQAKWLKWHESRRADADAYAGHKQPPKQAISTCNQNIKDNIPLTSNHTDPARAASLSPTGFAAHAKPPSMNQRMAAIAAKSRKAFVGNA